MSEQVIQNKPLAVLISDIHYTVQNLDLCTKALYQAMDKAKELGVELIIAGDLNDSKAVIRGEVANELIHVFKATYHKGTRTVVIPGNHDLLSVKDNAHSLNFLRPYTVLLDSPQSLYKMHLIPYQITNEAFLKAIEGLKDGTIVIAHQGFKGANLGSYFKDDSSVDPAAVKHLKIFSGHYHMHQDIGTVTYIGSPFTHTFGEANDGPKGYLVIYEDGSYVHHHIKLRKHIIVERTTENLYEMIENYSPGDVIQIKVTGTYNDLDNIDKKALGLKLIGSQDFKLDKIYTDSKHKEYKNAKVGTFELLDEIIDNTDESEEVKISLKQLWKALI